MEMKRVFRPSFLQDGLAAHLYEGDPSLARRLDLARSCTTVVLGQVAIAREPQNIGGLFIAELVADLRQISPGTGSILDEIDLRVKGGGLDRTSAISAASEKLASSIEAHLASWP